MASHVDEYLTSKALNALWGIAGNSWYMQRPKAWRPSPALLQKCTYEMLLKQYSVGEKTAALIMQWKEEK
jgi:hypothetical protein